MITEAPVTLIASERSDLNPNCTVKTARKYYCFECTPVYYSIVPVSIATVRAEYRVKWYSVNTYIFFIGVKIDSE